jgi:predicted transcriptional regulator
VFICRTEILRYTDLAAAIQLAKASGMTTREIVRELTRGMTHADALKFAKGAAPLSEFQPQIGRNGGNAS